jgi:nitrogen regulatory protein P-II 1
METNALRKITAIVRGITVTKVKGFGEYANFFEHDWEVGHARIEIFLRQERVTEIVNAIIVEARSGISGDGIIAVTPVEAVYRIRTGERAGLEELGGCDCLTP